MNNKYCRWILETITELYIFFIILIFPLMIGSKGYANILDVKYYTFASVSSLYILIILLTIFYFLFVKKYNYMKEIKINKLHYLILVFLLINIISCLFSPYKEYDLLLGLGRGEGLLNVILYTISTIFISIFYKFDKKILKYISISVILVSLIAFLEYLGYNPFNIYKGHTGPFNMSYMTTFGNKGVLSAFYTLTITISFASFVFLENKKHDNMIHLLSIFLGIFIFGVINVDSGLVAFGISLLVVIPFILLNNKYLSKTMIVGATVLLSYILNYILNPVYRNSTRIYRLEPQFDFYCLLYIIIIILFIISFFYIKKRDYKIKDKKKFIKKTYIFYPAIIILGIIIVYFIDFNIPLLNNIKSVLHGDFSDEIGTYRFFLWKRSLKIFCDYPLLGTGPDTFSYRFMSSYCQDVLILDHRLTINDTATNVYLTMLVNIGIIGFSSYLFYIFNLLKKLLSNIKRTNNISLIFFLGILCFLVQDFFNLSVVIVTPIFYTIMGISLVSVKSFGDF